MKTYNKFMEIFWLVIAILSGGTIGYLFFFEEYNEHPIFLALPFMALVMFLMRRWYRKRTEKESSGNDRVS
ncbi:hypothetical protein [Salibacter halophilus]|uniref:Uncharacterized protein n=1 Tax=Salibacter halophilus TaxID=1803916 RepID=A0A6N6M2K7_9FLAO|nr:hypothetical protein [Salibacter halophilus]KAB1063422.1 hypothetical protein F3059_10155 [Salibacter halophilus]